MRPCGPVSLLRATSRSGQDSASRLQRSNGCWIRWRCLPQVIAGSIVAAAGVYQWTPLKRACLTHCRSPLDAITHYWRPGAFGAFSAGARHGLYCLGCCAVLMALLFAGGIMNLAWIAGITVLVLAEKIAPGGQILSRVIGAALAVWGAITIGVALSA